MKFDMGAQTLKSQCLVLYFLMFVYCTVCYLYWLPYHPYLDFGAIHMLEKSHSNV